MQEKHYWEKKWSDQPLAPANSFARRAYKLIKARRLKTLLDLGCGDGRDAIYFSDKGLQVTALDFSKNGIRKLAVRREAIKCILKDISKIDLKANTFDVIYAHLSLHYFDDRTTRRIFDNLYKALRKGGLIFIKCKSTNDPLFGLGKKIGENIYKDSHVRHFFTKEYMAGNLRRFKIIRIRKLSSSYHGHTSSFIEAIAIKS